MRPIFFCLPALLWSPLPIRAQRVQTPDAPWKTITTTHYRIHYPAAPAGGFEPFAREVAARIEGIHATVTAQGVGYESPRVVDVLIRDPLLEANGSALSLLDHPFVELWKTPPDADSAIAHFTSWPELLLTHELAHIHHLTRPQNRPNLWDRWLDLPVGPIALKAPRWVVEGYATLLEGRLTGSGRPHGAYRAAVLRQWAREGRLAAYGALNGSAGFRGGNMAYLVGSAFLEWLERQNAGDPEILRNLWLRLASKKRRGFEACFNATFGLPPEVAYNRWRAETTHAALDWERRLKVPGPEREGSLWAHIPGEVTDLAVSPDGTQLLARIITPDFKGLKVWNLNSPPGPAAKPVGRVAEMPDPNEVADRPFPVPVRKADWELGRRDGHVPGHAAWQPGVDGNATIALGLTLPGEDGALQLHAATWDPERSILNVERNGPTAPPADSNYRISEAGGTWNIEGRRPGEASFRALTRSLSAAWNPAPTPDGQWLYYTQLTATGCEIRKLDLSLRPLNAETPTLDGAPFTPRTILPPADEASHLPPPVTPPLPHDYASRETIWNGLRSGATLAPSGESYELGYGGSDLLGRLSWLALAGFGNSAGPRGAALSFAYRGWRWAPSLHVFSSLERPSGQRFVPLPGWDRQRSGAEAAFTFESRNTTPATFRPVLFVERAQFQDPSQPAASRGFAGLELGLTHFWGRGEHWGLRLAAQARDGVGRTAGKDWQAQRGQVTAQFSTPLLPFTLRAESARVLGQPTPLDRLHLGGLGTSLVPASPNWNQLEQPALPAYSGSGDRAHRLRAEVGTSLRAYLEHTAVWNHTQGRAPFTRLAGVEFDLIRALGETDTVRRLAGRLTFIAGVHRILYDPTPDHLMRDRTVGTLSLVLRP